VVIKVSTWESMPIESLKELKNILIHYFVSFYSSTRSIINEYVQEMTDVLLDDKTQLWLTGRLVEFWNAKAFQSR
jgi:hypothetical protein